MNGDHGMIRQAGKTGIAIAARSSDARATGTCRRLPQLLRLNCLLAAACTVASRLKPWPAGPWSLPRLLLICFLTAACTGCESPLRQQPEVRHVDPVLSMSTSRAELVDYLNQQSHGLQGWRCMSTKLRVSLPGMPAQRLSGYIACKSPNYFRLTADNVIAKADLGSNNAHCWVYVRPGEAAVMTWKHEDTKLLQQIPSGVPFIDPNWLMLVLGISPLKADDYELSRGPTSRPELWLSAIEDSASGRPLRRVIKVDTVNGVTREHAVYDSEGNPLVRAMLSKHQRRNGHLIPTSVKLLFPQVDTELTLAFNGIETNPELPDHLWHLPDENVRVVDLGDMIRERMLIQNANQPFAADPSPAFAPRATLQAPVFHESTQQTAANNGAAVWDGTAAAQERGVGPTNAVEEPDWDTPISFRSDDQAHAKAPAAAVQEPRRRSFLSRMFGR